MLVRIGKVRKKTFSRTVKQEFWEKEEKTKNKEGEPRGESIVVEFCSSKLR